MEQAVQEKPTKPKDLKIQVTAPLKTQQEEEKSLHLERLKYLFETKIRPVADAFQEAEGLTKELRLDHERKMAEFALSLRMGKLDEDALGSFFKKPYPKLEPARDSKGRLISGTWRLSMPRFIPLSIGLLESQDEAWNYFRVNRFMDWFGEIPDFIKKQIGMKEHPEFEGLKIDGGDLVGPTEVVKKAWGDKNLRRFFDKMDGNRIKIDKNRAYDLTVALLREGVKPFSQNPIDPADLITPPPLPEGKQAYQLRPYQKTIWETLCRFSSIGVFIPPSTGKTVLGVHATTHLKPPHLIVVPTNTLAEQWTERIEHHSTLTLNQDVFVATYMSAIKKMSDREWTLVIFDEVHHIGAKYYIKLSWLKRKYSLSLSATPYREDQGGEELIFGLTGEPCGLAWQYFRDLRVIKSPICHVWIDRNLDAKLRRLADLLKEPKKTIIFSDSLELGKSVAARYKIPHIFGQSVERLKTLEESQTAVISRVGDEGVSLPDIERVIEISWLFGCIPGSQRILTPEPKAVSHFHSAVCGFDGKSTVLCEGLPFETRFDKVLTLDTCVGSFQCTPEHRVLTSAGYVEAERAKDVAVALRLPYALEEAGTVARLTGHLFGDGHLATDKRWKTAYRKGHCGWVKFFADPEDLEEIKIDLTSLGLPYNSKVYGGALRGGLIINSKGSSHRVHGRVFGINGKASTYRFFLDKGVPPGKRSDIDYQVPKWIMSGTKTVQREFLAGLFGSDADSVQVRSRRLNRLRYAFVKREDLVRNGLVFANQLRTLLKGLGVPSTPPKTRLCMTRKDGTKSIQIEFYINVTHVGKFVESVGFRYSRKKELSAKSVWIYLQEKQHMMLQRAQSHHSVMQLRRNRVPLREILIESRKHGEMDRTVKDWLYRARSPTQSPRWFPTFEKWRGQHTRGELGFVGIYNTTADEETVQCYDVQTQTENYLLGPSGFVLHNSRRQELQRFTRLLHGQKVEGEGHVLMTVDEYLRDKKRLFSIMDRGFKIVLHREGIDDKVLQSREPAPEPSHRGRVPKATSTSPVALPQIASTISERLPGVNRTLERLEPVERAVAQTILANPSRPYTAKELVLATGYSPKTIENLAHFSKLVKQGLIKREKGGKYQSAL